MKKHTILILFLLPCLLLSSCGTATDTTTTTAVTAEAPRDPLPAEERYTDETGRYVCKNVAINTEMAQYFVPYDARPNVTDSIEYTRIGCGIYDWEASTVAVVKKTASESYYTAYEDGRTPLAYTLSTIEIVSLPEGGTNYYNLKIGDSITIIEAYAFAPNAPDVIYRSQIIPQYSFHWGLIEFGNTYLVNIALLFSAIQCNETEKEGSEILELPEDCYMVAADIYPTDQAVYDAWMSETPIAGDLAIPTAYKEQSLQEWSIVYQQAYKQYVAS